MLTHLNIKNFGLIDQIDIEFREGINVLTGETGAGKSIIIDALRIVLGDKLQPSQIRNEELPCVIETAFEIKSKELLDMEVFCKFIDRDEDTLLIIHRDFHSQGRNKIKINGQLCTASQLKEIGNYLMDFHGPHDHQMLLSAHSHMGILDRLVQFDDVMNQYQQIFQNYKAIQQQLDSLMGLSASRERELDLLQHQIKELEQVPLVQQDYDELVECRNRINNMEKIYGYVQQIVDSFEGSTHSMSDRIRQCFTPMRTLNDLDPSTLGLMEQLDQVQQIQDQMINDLHNYISHLSFQPQQAQKVNEQYDIYDEIKRKYGPTLDEAKEFYIEAKARLQLLENFDQSDADLRKQIMLLEQQLKETAEQITKKRRNASKSLKKVIEQELKDLGIPNVKFDVSINTIAFHEFGQDEINFFISPNSGEPLKPLAQIISSGEAARVMLALKKALIKVDPIPVLIFDEIDAQIGGRLGTVTGEKLRELSKYRQVILITHLPQIASYADAHFKVRKVTQDGRAVTKVDLLDKKSRVTELAEMMSGAKENPISLQHANAMLSNVNR